jgi:hypothetical protein
MALLWSDVNPKQSRGRSKNVKWTIAANAHSVASVDNLDEGNCREMALIQMSSDRAAPQRINRHEKIRNHHA